MQKMKNKLTAIIISIFLILPINAWAVEDTAQYDAETQQAIEDVTAMQNLDEEADEITEEVPQALVSPYKQPISKKKIIKKFLFAMLGVALSSFILYFGLTFYNKVREKFGEPKVKSLEGETPLQSPVDFEGSVKTFLDKTKW